LWIRKRLQWRGCIRERKTLSDIDRLRKAGISNINVDLIAGLPHQTRESWNILLTKRLPRASRM